MMGMLFLVLCILYFFGTIVLGWPDSKKQKEDRENP